MCILCICVLFCICVCVLYLYLVFFCIAASTGVPRGVVSSNTHYQKALVDEGLFFGGQIFFGCTNFFWVDEVNQIPENEKPIQTIINTGGSEAAKPNLFKPYHIQWV